MGRESGGGCLSYRGRLAGVGVGLTTPSLTVWCNLLDLLIRKVMGVPPYRLRGPGARRDLRLERQATRGMVPSEPGSPAALGRRMTSKRACLYRVQPGKATGRDRRAHPVGHLRHVGELYGELTRIAPCAVVAANRCRGRCHGRRAGRALGAGRAPRHNRRLHGRDGGGPVARAGPRRRHGRHLSPRFRDSRRRRRGSRRAGALTGGRQCIEVRRPEGKHHDRARGRRRALRRPRRRARCEAG
jgi:hypothetical protein